ncbi:hypothetical protein LTR62_001318 [Meristemomyces frigidus]|uniref:Glutamine amidotransferase domain-containing protein n=1 Tax=Meristemomyces frigidus TaxID=1508187 RepID=A0AAN7TBC6_9PEZI|nr:hypothetical protein LTR62_001318 [Meristemomyces frigidus]
MVLKRNPPTIRLAILEADTPIGRTKEKYGGYGALFAELLAKGCEEVARQDGVPGPELEITKYDVVNHPAVYPALEEVDGVLITGSKHNSFDSTPWIRTLVAFTQRVLAQHRVRIIGVCFGHQILGRAMEVEVARSEAGWEVAVVPVELTEVGRRVLGVERLAIHQMHRDIVYAYPVSVEPLGSSDRCSVQGMYSKGRLISVQGHPEFNEEIVEELLVNRHEQGIFPDGVYEDGMRRVGERHDGVVVAAAFVRFLVE